MLYVVYIAVDDDRADEWQRWMLEEHIPDVMETGCFTDASLVRDADADEDGRRAYRVFYHARSEEAFDDYQDNYAEALQKEHTQRYHGAFAASREILPITHRFG